MDAQAAAVEAFVRSHDGRIFASFEEVESGRKNDRPQLEAAIARAKILGATLLIAKLDRLSRDALFLLTLQKAGVDFVACDMPDANNFTIGIMALIAQHEREAIHPHPRGAGGRQAAHHRPGQEKHPSRAPRQPERGRGAAARPGEAQAGSCGRHCGGEGQGRGVGPGPAAAACRAAGRRHRFRKGAGEGLERAPRADSARRQVDCAQHHQHPDCGWCPDRMIRIAISRAAFDAIAATLPFGSMSFENKIDENGERLIWFEDASRSA